MVTDVILPCLNGDGALPWVLSRMPVGFRPIVADNGSDDGSADVARRYGASVVHVPQRGFGAACHAGLLAATSETVCFMDADNSLDPADLPLVAGPVLAGAADLVLGRRRPQRRGSWPLHAQLGNQAIAAAVHRQTGLRLRDLGPMRAAGRAPLLDLGISDRRFGYPLEMVLLAARDCWRIAGTGWALSCWPEKVEVTCTLAGPVRTCGTRDNGLCPDESADRGDRQGPCAWTG